MRILALVLASALAVCFMNPASAATKRSASAEVQTRIDPFIRILAVAPHIATETADRKSRIRSITTERAGSLDLPASTSWRSSQPPQEVLFLSREYEEKDSIWMTPKRHSC